jgi:hypothetical protein
MDKGIPSVVEGKVFAEIPRKIVASVKIFTKKSEE